MSPSTVIRQKVDGDILSPSNVAVDFDASVDEMT